MLQQDPVFGGGFTYAAPGIIDVGGVPVRVGTGGVTQAIQTGLRSNLMYYNAGFLPSGANQTSLGGTLLSGLSDIFGAVIPKVFGQPGFQNPTIMSAAGGVPAVRSTAITKIGQVAADHPVLTAAGGAATVGGAVLAASGGVPAIFGGHRGRYAPAGSRGYHPIKKGPHAGLWTRNRHRNVCNPRALRRAISRAHGFAKLAMKTIHLIHPKKKGRFGGFRKRRTHR